MLSSRLFKAPVSGLLAAALLLSSMSALAMQEDRNAALGKVEVIDGSYLASEARNQATTRATFTPGIALLDEILTTKLPDDVAVDEVWVDINLEEQRLKVFRGYVPIKEMDHLAFGSTGAAALRLQGSSLTPTGEFRVDRINEQSKFKLFYGIDYPNKAVADAALGEGLITLQEHRHIHEYIDRHGMAPADTSLGGHIGIHGLGRGDAYIHENFNWTQGCVAVTNDEISTLSRYLGIGTRVVIRG